MRRLLNASQPPAQDAGQAADQGVPVDLDEAYAYPSRIVDAGRPWLRANMVASVDGAAKAPDGLSGGLSSPADKRIFGVLRGLADVVLVGASTVRQEGYRPPRPREEYAPARRAAGRPEAPVIAVVSRSLDLDVDTPLFTEALTPVVVLTCAAAPREALAAVRDRADVVVAGDDRVDPARAVAALAERGWTRLLTEGGPHLLGQIAEAGLLDELCLTLSPLLAGGTASRIVSGGAGGHVTRMRLAGLLEEDGFLFARYVRP